MERTPGQNLVPDFRKRGFEDAMVLHMDATIEKDGCKSEDDYRHLYAREYGALLTESGKKAGYVHREEITIPGYANWRCQKLETADREREDASILYMGAMIEKYGCKSENDYRYLYAREMGTLLTKADKKARRHRPEGPAVEDYADWKRQKIEDADGGVVGQGQGQGQAQGQEKKE